MKKALILATILCASAAIAQNTTTTTTTTTVDGKTHTASETTTYDKKVTVSAFGSFPVLNQAGVSVELFGNKKTKSMDAKSFSFYNSKLINVAYGMMQYEAPVPGDDFEADGSGFVVELGQRTYFLGTNAGPYMSNYLSYGNIKFEEDTAFGDFDGTYSYFSFFSPEIGYKLKVGGVAIDPFAGIMWKIEIKGEGDIDNRNVNEWTPRVGLRLGYEF